MKLDPRMADAMALVRAGNPMEATRLIQAITGRMHAAPEPPGHTADCHGDVIDIVPESVITHPAGPQTPAAALIRFRCRHGELAYRLHRPAQLPAGAPLLMMLHGCTQTTADFATGTRMNALAEQAGMAVLWPEQSTRANARRCWRWYEAAHQRIDHGEPALLLALAEAIAAEHRLDRAGLFVAGLSAGGAMAAILADCAPGHVRGVAIHSGLPAGAARSMAEGLSAMQKASGRPPSSASFVPTLVLHGTDDRIVAADNADALFAVALQRAGSNLTVIDIPSPYGRLTVGRDRNGMDRAARMVIARAGHAWSGGHPAGSFTSPKGPDASSEILRFFATQHAHPMTS